MQNAPLSLKIRKAISFADFFLLMYKNFKNFSYDEGRLNTNDFQKGFSFPQKRKKLHAFVYKNVHRTFIAVYLNFIRKGDIAYSTATSCV